MGILTESDSALFAISWGSIRHSLLKLRLLIRIDKNRGSISFDIGTYNTQMRRLIIDPELEVGDLLWGE